MMRHVHSLSCTKQRWVVQMNKLYMMLPLCQEQALPLLAHKLYLKYSNNMKTATEMIGCVDSATDILGNKWTPQLLRFLLNEKSVRFCQIQDLVGGINPRTLCARLDQLEQHGIIDKRPTATGSRCEYTLTDKGRDLLPVLQTMQDWSSKYPTPVTA